METVVLVAHIIVCVVLILLIVLQAGKDTIGTVFGGSSAGTVFGASGAGTLLTKLTAWFAFFFFITGLSYTYVVSVRPEKESVVIAIEKEVVKETTPKEQPKK